MGRLTPNSGELLLSLWYLRNIDHGSSPLIVVNYYLDYRTSETYRSVHICVDKVNYYLVYGTSETERQRVAHRRMVNYYLDYGISETRARCVVSVP